MSATIGLRRVQPELPVPRSKTVVDHFRDELLSHDPRIRARAYAVLESWVDEPERDQLIDLIWEFRDQETEIVPLTRSLRQLMDETDPRLLELLFSARRQSPSTRRQVSTVFAGWCPLPLAREIKARLEREPAPSEVMVDLAMNLFQCPEETATLQAIIRRAALAAGCENAWVKLWDILGSEASIRSFLTDLVDGFLRRPPRKMPVWYKMLNQAALGKLGCPEPIVHFLISMLPHLWRSAPRATYGRALAGTPSATAEVVLAWGEHLGPELVALLIRDCPQAAERLLWHACGHENCLWGPEFSEVISQTVQRASPLSRLQAFAHLTEDLLPTFAERLEELVGHSVRFHELEQSLVTDNGHSDGQPTSTSESGRKYTRQAHARFQSLLTAAWETTLARGGFLWRFEDPADVISADAAAPPPQLFLLVTMDQVTRRAAMGGRFVPNAEFQLHQSWLRLVDLAPFDQDHPPNWALVASAPGPRPPVTVRETLKGIGSQLPSRPFDQPIAVLRIPTTALPQTFDIADPARSSDLSRVVTLLRAPASRLGQLLSVSPVTRPLECT